MTSDNASISASRDSRTFRRDRSRTKEAVARFCQHFGIARLTDLPAREVAPAVAYLDMITAEVEAMTSDARAADPRA